MDRCDDPHDPLNSPAFYTGRPCIEPGCKRPAGTGWSPYWCQPCNAARLHRIDQSLRQLLAESQTRGSTFLEEC